MSKRALVLSGGGSKGAYSVGVVKALLESGRQYDVIAGVSVGALIGVHLAMSSPVEQLENYAGLEKVWKENVKGNRSIYKRWAPWFLTYIWSLWKTGIFNMAPLRKILQDGVDADRLKNSGVEFEVGVVSLQTGNYHSVNITSDVKNNELAIDWVWASSAFPVLFPPVKIGNEQWIDGGVRDVIPIKDVLKYDVTHVDAVITSPRRGYVPTIGQIKTSLDVGLRSAELLSDEVYIGDLEAICKNNNIELETFAPTHLVNEDSFEFNSKEIHKLIELGYNDTKSKLQNS